MTLAGRGWQENVRRRLQKSVERAVEKERYEWQTMRVLDDGAVKVE